MDIRYKVYDSEEKDLYIGVTNHYFQVDEARSAYRNSNNSDKIDNTILIQVAKDGAKEVEVAISFGVKEGEKLAIALLNLCQLIKD